MLRRGELPNEAENGAMSTMTAILGRLATYSGHRIEMSKALANDKSLADIDSLTRMDDTAPVTCDSEGYYPIPVPGVTNAFA